MCGMGVQAGRLILISQDLVQRTHLILELPAFLPSHFGIDMGHLTEVFLKRMDTLLCPVVLKLVSMRIIRRAC